MLLMYTFLLKGPRIAVRISFMSYVILVNFQTSVLSLLAATLMPKRKNFCDYSTECICGSNGGLVNILPRTDIDLKSITNDPFIKKLNVHGDLVGSYKDNAPPTPYGRLLIDMCKSAGLLILNGRVGKDKGIGNFTWEYTTGRSTVDYVVLSPQLLELVIDFAIANACPESDNIPLSLCLRCTSEKTYACKTRYSVWEYDKIHLVARNVAWPSLYT